MCFAAAVHISHHLKQSVVFVDTTGGLTAKRLLQMLEAETSSKEEQVRLDLLGARQASLCLRTSGARILCCMAVSVLLKGMFSFCALVKQVCLHRWRLFRGSTSSACLMSSPCLTVCTASVPAHCSRLVFTRPVVVWRSQQADWHVCVCVRPLLAAALSRQWSWTQCQPLSLLYWEENRMKVIYVFAYPSHLRHHWRLPENKYQSRLTTARHSTLWW